jgi:hypothetical protein
VIKMASLTKVKTISMTTPTMINKLAAFVFGDVTVQEYDPNISYVIDEYVYRITDDGGLQFYQCIIPTTGMFDSFKWQAVSVIDIMGSATVISETKPLGSTVSTWIQPKAYDSGDLDSIIPEMDPTKLEYIRDTNGMTIIGYGTTKDGSPLFNGDVKTPNNIEGYEMITIGENAFKDVSGIDNLIISDNVIKLMPGALAASSTDNTDVNTYISGVEFGYGLTTIPYKAFSNQKLIKSVDIVSSIDSIEEAAFENCIGLETVTIRGRDCEIHENAFEGCTSLTTIQGSMGSSAERFATNKNLTFKSI